MFLRLALLGLFLVGSITPAPQRKDGNFKLIILHNNDMHARFEQTGAMSNKCKKEDADNNRCYGGFARVAHKVREYREKAEAGEIASVLYLNAGDTYTGTPWFQLYKDKIASDFLKILKPDAISLGNHEFDEGTENLAKFLNEVDFPVLVANMDIEKEPGLKSKNLMNSITFEKEGRNIGVIGYLTPETKEVAIENKVEFTEEIDAINAEAAKLKSEGVNIIIALGHSGLEKDKQIAAECPDIDLVIGGHSHTFLYTGQPPDIETPHSDYPNVVEQDGGKKVPVVQAYAYTKYLGYLDLEFDDAGNLLKFDGTPILLDATVPRDPDVLALLEVYRPGIIALENEVVGMTKVLLDGNCRRRECNLGNLIADAFVDWNALNHNSGEFWTDAAIGFIQGGGVRSSIDHTANSGNITREDALTVMPFESKLDIVEVTGAELMEAFEHSVSRYHDDEPRGEFMQYSGVQIEYDINRPSGSRVVNVKVLCADCSTPDLQNVDLAKRYRIVMPDFVADGGDGYHMFKGKAVRKTEAVDVDVMAEYMKRKSPIYAAVEWRITLKDILSPSEDIIGHTKVTLDNNCRQAECNLGNFITDAMVDFYSSKYEGDDSWTDASIAVIQGSRLRSAVAAKTNISMADANQIFQPAAHKLNLVTLTGNEIKATLEHAVSNHGSADNVEFLQMSGLQVEYDLKKPSGMRVLDVQVLCAKCDVPALQQLVGDAEYKVIMQSVMATGADGYNSVFGGKAVKVLEITDSQVFVEYVKKKSPVHQAVEWRITIHPAIVDPSKDEIGKTKVLLDNQCQQAECNLGNMIADSMVDWYALQYTGEEFWTDASIAIIQGSKIKASIDPKTNNGVIYRSDVNKIFEPEFQHLHLVTFSGAEIVKILEHAVSDYNNGNNVEFLQVSGLQAELDVRKPAGQRVVSVKVLCASCVVPELIQLTQEAEYKVIMQASLANGGDGYGSIFGSKTSTDLTQTDGDVFVEYVRKKSPVHQAVEWRLTIHKDDAGTTDLPTTTLGGSNLQVSSMLILLTTILSLIIKR